MRLSAIQFIVKLSVLLSSLLLVQGCVNLEAVRDFSKQSAALTSASDALDYRLAWPERRKEYDDIAKSLPPKGGTPASGPTLPATKMDKAQEKTIKSVHIALASYMEKLGELADDKIIDVSPKVDGLVKNLDNLPDSDDDRKKSNAAYGAILKLLKLPLDAYRQAKIKDLIIENDDSVQQLTNLLAAQTKNISMSIESERGNVLLWLKETDRKYPQQASLMYAIQKRNVKSEIEEKYKGKAEAINSYSAALTKIGETHHDMAEKLQKYDTDAFKLLESNLKSAKEQIEQARKQYAAAFDN